MWAFDCTNRLPNAPMGDTQKKIDDLSNDSGTCTVDCDYMTLSMKLTVRRSVGLSDLKVFRVCYGSGSQPVCLVFCQSEAKSSYESSLQVPVSFLAYNLFGRDEKDSEISDL